ncbi:MAG: YigZ family protein [Succinivibrio sp.]
MATDTYQIPDLKKDEFHRTELVVKKSRFITSVARTHGVDEAKAFIDKICAEFSDARHNCFAYNADKPGTSGYAGCSDDGEPHGTAGQPMLNVLLHAPVGEITVVVTRYFGGILLGTGGLVKAYQDSVKNALDSLKTTDMVLMSCFSVELDHSSVTLFQRLAKQLNARIVNQEYTQIVRYTIDVPNDSVEQFTQAVTKMTSGTCRIEKLD